jgi:hypothetical protein
MVHHIVTHHIERLTIFTKSKLDEREDRRLDLNLDEFVDIVPKL